MKVGTDGVLLGAWADVTDAKTVLDIGTGSGLIALMIAQRAAEATIDAVEILESDAIQARENVDRSPWASRIKVHQTPIQDFESSRTYDLIVSNPPYFTKSQLPERQHRASVRHTVTLSHDELISAAAKLLASKGKFATILPPAVYEQFVVQADKVGLHVRQCVSFHTRPGKPVERYLLEMVKEPTQKVAESMCLYTGAFDDRRKDMWSSEYRALVGEFYL